MTPHQRGDANLITSLQRIALNHDSEIQMSVVKAKDNTVGAFVENWKYIDPCVAIRRVGHAIWFQAERTNDDIAELQKPA